MDQDQVCSAFLCFAVTVGDACVSSPTSCEQTFFVSFIRESFQGVGGTEERARSGLRAEMMHCCFGRGMESGEERSPARAGAQSVEGGGNEGENSGRAEAVEAPGNTVSQASVLAVKIQKDDLKEVWKHFVDSSAEDAPSLQIGRAEFKVRNKAREVFYESKKTSAKIETKPWDRENYVRFVVVSDTHGRHDNPSLRTLPEGEVLIHCGDLSSTGEPSQLKGLREWMRSKSFKHRVVIAGNHDTTLDAPYFKENFDDLRHSLRDAESIDPRKEIALFKNDPDFVYLDDEVVSIEGYNIFGSPITPSFCGWAFNRGRGPAILTHWKKIPDECEILITHGPAAGFGDWCLRGAFAGCLDLLHEVQVRVRPLVHLCGHIHESNGAWTDGQTTFINAATCNIRYKPMNHLWVFDLPRKQLTKG